MIHFFDDTKIFVLAPAGVVTGGSELLHQFVDALNNRGKQAYIVYIGTRPHQIPKDYSKYKIQIAEDCEDGIHNIIVLYEGMFGHYADFKSAQILLWWLSVDLMYHSLIDVLSIRDIASFSKKMGCIAFRRRISALLKRGKNLFTNSLRINELSKENFVNAYQSVYAQQFLYKNGFDQLMPLSDYINMDFVDGLNQAEKEDIVLYNPKKGIEFTKKIINNNPELKFVPIQNLDRKGVMELLKSAKVYIDFGFHPGKDRIPREAALSGCVVITGRNGSAYYYEDVAIPAKYKFNANDYNIAEIGKMIHYIFENFETSSNDMEYYRKKIRQEKDIFYRQLDNLIQN